MVWYNYLSAGSLAFVRILVIFSGSWWAAVRVSVVWEWECDYNGGGRISTIAATTATMGNTTKNNKTDVYHTSEGVWEKEWVVDVEEQEDDDRAADCSYYSYCIVIWYVWRMFECLSEKCVVSACFVWVYAWRNVAHIIVMVSLAIWVFMWSDMFWNIYCCEYVYKVMKQWVDTVGAFRCVFSLLWNEVIYDYMKVTTLIYVGAYVCVLWHLTVCVCVRATHNL